MTFLSSIPWPGAKGVVEILVMAVALYYIILFFQGTRGAQVLSGFAVLLVSLLVLTNVFQLNTLTWLLQRFSVYLAVGFLIIFQPEIRRALAELGRQHFFAERSERTFVDKVVKSALMLAEGKIGAIMAIEREVGLKGIQENGTPVDAELTPELLSSIFYPHTPLHDGGVIIQGDRVAAAGCLFPLSQRPEISKALGTRHRAAIGLTEESDAVVVVVSEETGTISLAYRGRLRRGLDEERLRRILAAILGRGRSSKAGASRLRRAYDVLRSAFARPRALARREVQDHAG
jgi:diadenylate cyclase